MSKSTTKKPVDKSEPMDASVREAAVGTPSNNTQRVCYAGKTLVTEVHSLFPETPVEYSNYDGRNTALDVSFDLTTLDAESDRIDLPNLLELVEADERVSDVLVEDDLVLVSFKPNLRTQDSREPFGLADALSVLSGDEWGGSL